MVRKSMGYKCAQKSDIYVIPEFFWILTFFLLTYGRFFSSN